jgi:steroid delta-isomerase-like uncharacterized protein
MYNTARNNQKIIEAYFKEVWNQGKLELLDDLIAPDYINHSPSMPNPRPGPEGLKPIIAEMRKGIPDLNYEIKDLVVTREKVVARLLMTGTHTGELWGIQPTGKEIRVNQINIEHFRNGRISEHWRVTEELNLMKQLGVV